jgi:hypothetical protein
MNHFHPIDRTSGSMRVGFKNKSVTVLTRSELSMVFPDLHDFFPYSVAIVALITTQEYAKRKNRVKSAPASADTIYNDAESIYASLWKKNKAERQIVGATHASPLQNRWCDPAS